MSVVSGRMLCASLLAVALFHALAQARVRPLFQSSDELNYTFAAQYLAWTTAPPSERPCIFPPDGTEFHMPAGSGKPGFRRVTAAELELLCRWAPDGPSFFRIRAIQAFSLPVMTACAWQLGLLLSGQTLVAALAAMLVALHPVAAMYSGAIGPDAGANALSAIAFTAGARIILRRSSWWHPVVLVSSTVAAIFWKDTTNFLLLHALLVFAVAAAAAIAGDLTRWSWTAAIAATSAVLVCIALVATLTELGPGIISPYLVGLDAARATSAPLVLVGRILGDVVTQTPGILWTLLTGIGSFGASSLEVPVSSAALALVLLTIGVVGLFLQYASHWTRLATEKKALAVIWAVCGTASLLQPSIRQLLLETGDTHQGRWLLPLMAPVATAIAIGLRRWIKGWPPLVLVFVLGVASVLLTQLRMIEYFYTLFPTQLRTSGLFLRSTGGAVIDDAKVLVVIEHALRSQSTAGTWLMLGALVLSASLAWAVLVGMSRRVGTAGPPGGVADPQGHHPLPQRHGRAVAGGR